MTIEHADEGIVIKIPDAVDLVRLQELIDYLIYQETTSKSEATQEQVNQLSSKINKDWWQKNKERFLDRWKK